MSTHSYIGVIEEDGTLKYVYCHSDGYPSYLGRMLLTYYNTPELATGLVNLGDLSMVRSILRERLVPDKGEFHTFKKPVREGPKGGITTAYHRDRKERLHINKTVIGGIPTLQHCARFRHGFAGNSRSKTQIRNPDRYHRQTNVFQRYHTDMHREYSRSWRYPKTPF